MSTVCPCPCNPVYTLCSYENGTTHQVLDLQAPEMASFSVWQRGQLVPEMMPGEGEDSFQIILEGRTQGDHPGAIALDDLIFHPDCRWVDRLSGFFFFVGKLDGYSFPKTSLPFPFSDSVEYCFFLPYSNFKCRFSLPCSSIKCYYPFPYKYDVSIVVPFSLECQVLPFFPSSVSNTTITPLPTVHPENCTEDEFKCADGMCIPASKHCNFVADCPLSDNSDEADCGKITTTATTTYISSSKRITTLC